MLLPRAHSSVNSIEAYQGVSRDQQDLASTPLFYCGLSLGGLAEGKFAADRDRQLAIPYRFRHELERLPVEFREHELHIDSRVLGSVLRSSNNGSIHSTGLDLRDQLFGGSS